MENEESKNQADIDWANRILCSDPACIGIIGAHGRCKECGQPYEGETLEGGSFGENGSEIDDIATEQVETYEEPEADVDESIADEEWKNRKLCCDPACIGVIGADGRCKECGTPYKEA